VVAVQAKNLPSQTSGELDAKKTRIIHKIFKPASHLFQKDWPFHNHE